MFADELQFFRLYTHALQVFKIYFSMGEELHCN
jgi:hypothetical protein